MATIKCVFMFDVPKGGWSEVWYLNVSNIEAAKTPCDNLSAVRGRLLGKFATLEAVRISTVDPPRRSLIRVENIEGTADGSNPADTPWQAVMGSVKDTTGIYQRVTMLRGIPDTFVNRRASDGRYDMEAFPVLLNRWNAYMASLRSNGFMFRARSAEGAGGIETQVTGFSILGGKIAFTPAAGLAVGDYVTFRDVTGLGSEVLKGKHRVRKVEAGEVTLDTTAPPAPANPVEWVPGKVRPKVTGYFPVLGGSLQRPAHRDTGRPFFLGRGRRSATSK